MVPAVSPVSMPEVEPMVPTAVLLLLQVALPPLTQVSADEEAAHTPRLPLMAGGLLAIFTDFVTKHPLPVTYVIITAPAVIPRSTPVDPLMLPTAGLLLDHVPPVTACVYVPSVLIQTYVGPLMAAGAAETVTTRVLKHEGLTL